MRFDAALTHYLSRFIIVSGGKESSKLQTDELSNKCDVYDIVKNQWYAGPQLVLARHNHSSCTLNHSVYVFFGDQKQGYQGTIECLNALNLAKAIEEENLDSQ